MREVDALHDLGEAGRRALCTAGSRIAVQAALDRRGVLTYQVACAALQHRHVVEGVSAPTSESFEAVLIGGELAPLTVADGAQPR